MTARRTCARTRGRLWDPDQEGADHRNAHRAYVEAARERGQARRAGQSGAQGSLGLAERAARALQRARHEQLGGTLEDRERGRRDVGARIGSLALGQAHRAGDEDRGDDARNDEADREDDAGRRRDDRDDTDRTHADDRRDKSWQESLDDNVADLINVGSRAGHEIASAQRGKLRSGGRSQHVVEVVAQAIHARQRHLVGSEA